VIVRNSEFIKESAWNNVFDLSSEKVLSNLKAAREKFSQAKGNRYDIIRHVLESEEVAEKDMESHILIAAEKYDAAVQKGILKLQVNPKDRDALIELSKKYKLFINSATPGHALRQTLVSLSIADFFTEALGSERSKVENLKKIITSGFDPDEITFVGDGENDAFAAQSVGCTFIAVLNDWNKWDKEKFPYSVKEISEISAIINKVK
jgi:phosphoglycolate phosphatase-like HAD superfamily hydrolase